MYHGFNQFAIDMVVEVQEIHSSNLTQLLEQLNCSIVITTYQAGQVITIGRNNQNLSFSFSSFPHAMGIARTPSGLALATKNEVWQLNGQRELAAAIAPAGTHDIAFLARSCHVTGPVMSHELAWCGGDLVLVNTLCNCLAVPEAPWSFKPIWKPPFISDTTPSDRCHLNGVAISEDKSAPDYVTMHGISGIENGWRDNKAIGGAIMEVSSGHLIARGLSMPHSPRLYNNKLYALNSGKGELLQIDRKSGEQHVIAELPGFTRGLDFIGNMALVGLSRIRESAVFGGLPLQERQGDLRCGVALVDLELGKVQGHCWFNSGVEEIFSVLALPSFRNPKVIGASAKVNELDEASQTIWFVPNPNKNL